MAKVSKSILFAYNKCAEIATKWQNILDSYRHKDEKIPLSDLEEDITVEVIDNLTSTDVDKPLSANQGKVLKDQQDVNSQNIDIVEQEIQQNASSIVNLENDKLDAGQYQGTADDFSVRANDEIIIGLKSFLYDKLGFRNFANTFTSYFRNSNTASRYYTFQNRNGIIADDTDLATKQDKFSGILNRIPKSIGEFVLGVSRLFDDGRFFGIDTTYSPSKDITLKNGETRIIGVEESDANTKGQDLRIEAGRTNDYRVDSAFTSYANLAGNNEQIAISPVNDDVYVLLGYLDNRIYKQTGGQGNFVLQDFTSLGLTGTATYIYISPQNHLYIGISGNQTWKQTNLQGNFVNTGFSGQVVNILGNTIVLNSGKTFKVSLDNGVSFSNYSLSVSSHYARHAQIMPNGDIYFLGSFTNTSSIYKQENNGALIETFNIDKTAYYFQIGLNNTMYLPTTGGIYEQINLVGGFVLRDEPATNYRGITMHPVNGNIYIGGLSEIFELSMSAKGTPNLDGGTLNLVSGTGKGTGQSRIRIITGNKTASGTTMQTETERGYFDENGFFVYYFQVFADNTAALNAGLPNNAIYKDNNGNLKSVFIPQ